MPNQKIPPSFRQKRRLGLIALAPMMATMAMSPQFVQAAAKSITATAKYDAKIDKVVVAGKTAKTIAAGAKITAYDASNNIILYSVNSNAKNAFSMQLLGTTTVPCLVRLEVTNPQDNSQSQVVLPVKGAAASCKTVPACAITKPATDTEITVGSSVAFDAAKVKGDYLWSINDGSTDEKQAAINHSFTSVGKFRVQLTVTDGT
ncbi:MAG: PKD domain-containing protein, partial [Methylococcaceae bacterium]